MTQPSRTLSHDPGRPYLIIPRSEAEDLIVAQINRADGCLSSPITDTDALKNREWQYKIWDDYNLELFRRIYSDNSCAKEYEDCLLGCCLFIEGEWPMPSFSDDVYNFFIMVKVKRNCLQSIKARLPLIPEAPAIASHTSHECVEQTGPIVFLVHGHDNGMKETVARFLEKLNLKVMILHERPSEGRTIIEKLEAQSKGVGFAVVLLTQDDVGRAAEEVEIQPRARQNVILELGFFIGKIGRSRVAALYSAGVELPSDYDGVLYTPMDDRDGWRLRLAREIKAAGLSVDLNDAL
ncbi:MAG: nucleotide-binding protein [Methanospirillum sp.]